jgi:thiol-disulfide isomerase/thioredoxin
MLSLNSLTKFLIVGLFIFSLSGQAFSQSSVGQKMPLSAKLSLIGGKSKKTIKEVLKGRDLSIIQFWASWCVGCGDVMAQLAKRSKTDPSVGYFSISIDEDMPTAVRYFKSKPPEVTAALPNALLDKGGETIASPLNIKSLPIVIIASEDGVIKEVIAGHPKPEELTKLIAKLRQTKSK